MIDVNQNDIVAARHTADGRFVIFTRTDILPQWEQRFWGVVLDTGGDGHGTLVRYGPAGAPAGWNVRQLVMVVQARMAEEHARDPQAGALAVMNALARAKAFQDEDGMKPFHSSASADRATEGDPQIVAFQSVGFSTPYTWTVAACGDLSLPLCPDPESRGEGVTPEQVLIVIEQMLVEWARRSLHLWPIQEARLAAKAALAAEVHRVAVTRGTAGRAGSPV